MARMHPVPAQAMSWLLQDASSVLVVGPVPGLLRMIDAEVVAIDTSLKNLHRSTDGRASLVGARPENLPFEPERFDLVLFVDNLHTVDRRRAFAQIARVLRPGGGIGVVYTTRDDSVPWVRRLAALLQQVDQHAMTGGSEIEATNDIGASRYFPVVETAQHRTFFPMGRDAMLAMVQRRNAIAAAPVAVRDRLLTDVAALYDSMARAPEPLNLPYVSRCWRAEVCQDEMSIPIQYEDGLRLFSRGE